MRNLPANSETTAAARAMFADALGYLEGRGVSVELHAHEGTWGYAVNGKPTTSGSIVALALQIAPPGDGRKQ